MIDVEKYTGHTEGAWTDYNAHSVGVKGDANHSNHRIAIMDLKPEADVKQAEHIANRKLIADAPIILEDYKRLRKDFKGLGESLKQQLPHCKDKEMIEWIIEKIQEMIE